MSGQDCEQLTLFQGDSPASRSAWPGSAEAGRMTVTSGRKCLELSRNSGPLGLLEKMLLESSAWRSTRCYLNWKVSATPARRLLFRLVPSTPRTGVTDAPLWHTPSVPGGGRVNPPDMSQTGMLPDGRKRQVGLEHQVRMVEQGLWPTPTVNGNHNRPGSSPKAGMGLATAVAMFPTPTRFDAECGDLKGKEHNGQSRHAMKLIQAAKMFPTPTSRCGTGASQTATRRGGPDLQTEVGGQLNQTWVEWLMGFPLGWTDLDA